MIPPRDALANEAANLRLLQRENDAVAGGAPSPAPRFRLLSDVELEQMPPIEFLVDGVMPTAGLGAIYGAPGAGKSFLALDMACAIATGSTWLGRQTKQGAVVYIAAEGSAGLKQRLGAWKSSQGLTGVSIPIFFLTEPANLMTPADLTALLLAFDLMVDLPVLVIIDTLHRSMPGGDENSAKDVGSVIEHADRLRKKIGCAVLLVHHSALNSERERGSSSLRGAVDALLFAKSDDGRRELRCEKAKDWAPFDPMPYELQLVETSCVVSALDERGSNDLRTLTRSQREALTALSQISLDDGASATEWLNSSGMNDSSFFRARKDLVTHGYVIERKRGNSKRYLITDSGRWVVTPTSQSTPTELPDPQGTLTPTTPTPL